jgi:DNA-binding HxlR family transcriptional regulator
LFFSSDLVNVAADHAGVSAAVVRATPLEIGGRYSIAGALEAVERWSLLIVREAVKGRTRFVDFEKTLRASKAVLADRLDGLVAVGVLERRTYREPGRRVRHDYHLTQAGRDLLPVLAGLSTWGDTHMAGATGPPSLWRHRVTGARLTVSIVDGHGRPVVFDDVEIVPGPGATHDPSDRRSRCSTPTVT